MPFKLKLKKSRQYNVSSKNLFVLSVELLDNTTVECTLSSQNLGQECLNNVCQRLMLQQPQYFGLRFLSKKGTFWWVDLSRPLKKQLDKYALENSNLYLGVMFFVSDVNLLHDEVTRYHYFLQLKSDILEGKLHCNDAQTISFASYSLQAEFGDHDPERHTPEYLTNFGLIPKQMALPKESRDAILEQVIQNHRSLQGMSQQLAEVYYIMEAQQLSGYGLECFAAKDSSGNSVIIGVSLMGIYIWYLNNQPSVYFPWDQILNLVHNKKCFGIEYHGSSKVLQTYLEDSHLAKYVWKTCIQQHSFYTKNEGILNQSGDQTEPKPPTISVVAVNSKVITVNNEPKNTTQARSQYKMLESQESLDGLGVYHTDSGYSEIMPSSSSYTPLSSSTDITPKPGKQQSSSLTNLPTQPNHMPRNVSNTCLAAPASNLQPSYSQPLSPALNSSQSNLSQLKRVSLSDISVHRGSQQNVTENKAVSDPKIVCSALPVYRQAPDYDTAIKLKYGVSSCSVGDVSTSRSSQPHVLVSGSQIDLPHVYSDQQAPAVQSYAHYKNYTDLSHIDINEFRKNLNLCDTNVLIRNQDHVSAPTLHPPVHTYSSPDLVSQSIASNVCAEGLISPHLLFQMKPPPPYPYKQKTSSSTPDLSTNHQPSLPCSSPDLALQRTALLCPNPTQSPQNLSFQVATSFPVQYLPQRSIAESVHGQTAYVPTSVSCAKIVTSNAIPHQTIASSQKVGGSQGSLPVHTYQNYNPAAHLTDSSVKRLAEPAPPFANSVVAQEVLVQNHLAQAHFSMPPPVQNVPQTSEPPRTANSIKASSREEAHSMGPMLVAAMNGLSLSRPDIVMHHVEEKRVPNDARIQALESRLAEGQVFLEFERIVKKKPNANFSTAMLPENLIRNRFKDVFPYEENRVRLTPTTENKTGYINASHLSVSLKTTQRFYIAAQGPLPNTLYSFWQMVWEHHVSVIVMLTEVQEQGRDKCFPYWPQEDGNKLQIGEFQIVRNFSLSSPTYVTCSLSLGHVTSLQQRSVWHIQYTDWPDHSCPQDIQGFIAFMSEVDAVRRHTMSDLDPRFSSSPLVVHCSAGVGRSGAVILCDIMLYCLDHNLPVDLSKVLTHLRLQRMLTVQTLAQYKFVYSVLIQYLKNSRLI